jgi:hypothetical protein
MSELKPFDQVDKAVLKANVDVLNTFIEGLEEPPEGLKKVRKVGVKGEAMYAEFDAAVRLIAKTEGVGDDLDPDFVNFYNSLYEAGEPAGDGGGAGEATEPPPAKKPGPMRVPYKSYDELLEFLKTPPTPTNHMDQLLIEGGTMKELIAAFLPYADKVGYKTLRTPNTLKSHIRYREERGWKFKWSGEEEDPSVKLVGYEHPAPKK